MCWELSRQLCQCHNHFSGESEEIDARDIMIFFTLWWFFYLDNMFRNNSFGRGSIPFLHIYMIWQAGSGVWVLGCPQVSKRWLREETDFGPRVNGSGTLYEEEEAGHWVKNKIRFWRQRTTTTGMKLNLQSNKMYQETRTKLNLVLKYIWYLRFKHSGL